MAVNCPAFTISAVRRGHAASITLIVSALEYLHCTTLNNITLAGS